MQATQNEIFQDIAKRHFGITVLETQGLDRLDFHNVSVWSLRKALQEAYDVGYNKRVQRESCKETKIT